MDGINALRPLVWIDMEMTGLDPDRDRVLEIAVVLTDGSLERRELGPDLVVHQSADILEAMDEWNTKHHGESGLIGRALASSLDAAAAETEVLDWLIAQGLEPRSCPLAGNSVHQDRAFLRRWMPRLHDFLHYRNVDVSTVKELARRWAPQTLEAAPAKSQAHRALDDILESIDELIWYRENLFQVPPPTGAADGS